MQTLTLAEYLRSETPDWRPPAWKGRRSFTSTATKRR